MRAIVSPTARAAEHVRGTDHARDRVADRAITLDGMAEHAQQHERAGVALRTSTLLAEPPFEVIVRANTADRRRGRATLHHDRRRPESHRLVERNRHRLAGG